MAINDDAVITAAVGYVFVGNVGNARPTPAEIETIDPALFGALVHELKISGTPTGGTFTITVGTDTTTALAYNASAAVIQAALEALDSVGTGNVTVTGTSLTAGLDVAWIGRLQGSTVTPTSTDTLTGTGTPASGFTVKTALNGWKSIGHTSREDMPEFGFDGGDKEVKGTWQKAQLREVETDPVVDFLTLFLHQFDTDTFELYYGADASATPGVFGVSGSTTAPVEKAFLIIVVDGPARVGFYAPKASIRRDDAIQMPVDEFAALPIRATWLKHGTSNLFEWINEDMFS
jgi:hypothetical protein